MPKILEIFKRVMGNIIETIAVVGKQLAPDGGKIDTALIPQFNMMFGKATESTAAGIAKEYNVTPMQLQAGIQKYANDPEFKSIMDSMRIQQEQEFQRLGLSPARA